MAGFCDAAADSTPGRAKKNRYKVCIIVNTERLCHECLMTEALLMHIQKDHTKKVYLSTVAPEAVFQVFATLQYAATISFGVTTKLKM